MTDRQPTPTDKVAEDFARGLVKLDPLLAVSLGWEDDGRCPDYSPEGVLEVQKLGERTVKALGQVGMVDEVDRVTQREIKRQVNLESRIISSGLAWREINVIHCPPLDLRSVFDQMPQESVRDWELINLRLTGVPAAMASAEAGLRYGIKNSSTPARRQALRLAKQLRKYARDFFVKLAQKSKERVDNGPLLSDLTKNFGLTRVAYEVFADFLEKELAPVSRDVDGFGRELYALVSERFVGMKIDLDEYYEWGLAELARTVNEQSKEAQKIRPDATIEEAIAVLDADPNRKLHGKAALKEWMQKSSDAAVAALAAVHFDIPDKLKRLECMIAPTSDGAIYYTGPSEDFSRPGQMWWSVPEGVEEFNTWRELTTVYHEGVPGHHLQVGTAVYNRGSLNTFRRSLNWCSGHGEGWALYAERLMDQLGFLEDPGTRLGMLDGQRMRAARVVLDLGVHLGKEVPEGGEIWNYDYALKFMAGHVSMPRQFVEFEVNRYLGWAGQAPSYKIGQRVWEELRDARKKQLGSDFSLRGFHTRALNLGGVSLDTLQAAVLDRL